MLADRRTKIVATIGPATNSPENLRKLIQSGINVARLNFSHGTQDDHKRVIDSIRTLSRELAAPVSLLQDLQGPKIRIGKVKNGAVEIKSGQKITVTTRKLVGDEKILSTEFETFLKDVSVGQKILLDDGNLEFVVDRIKGDEVECTVIYGGVLKDNKGMNLPGARLSVNALTEKDIQDLDFGLKEGVDYVALSFVRSPEDIKHLRSLIEKKSAHTRIIAKIEKFEALDALEEIIAASDGVMVARGDLAVEVGQSLLPGIQKSIIHLCNEQGKPVITATQMLDSMVNNPRPTRAEITDIANAVLDGSDALMLSAESASGRYPFKCVETMDEVIREVERTGVNYYKMNFAGEFLAVAEAIAASACLSALKLNATAIVCLTTSGKTATLISRYRPKAQIIAVTHKRETLDRLELVWGIQTIPIEPYTDSDSAMKTIEKLLLDYGLVKQGDRVILTMGLPVLERGTTNSIRVYTIKSEPHLIPNEQMPLRMQRG